MTAIDDPALLAALLRPHLGATAALSFRRVGTGKHNASYWVHCADRRFVLRLAPPDDAGFLFYERRMMRQEPDLHALIRARTAIPVAEVIAQDFSRAAIDRDWLLLAALPGTPLSDVAGFSAPRLDRALQQVGAHLRALHDLTAPSCLGMDEFGYLGAHRPMAPQPTWEAAFRVMWNRLLDDVVACGCYSVDEAQALRDLLERHRVHFARPIASALLHMDVWSQNILVDERGDVTGLVDLDRALWGDVEIEFAVLDYCGISEPAFWEGYGAPRDRSPAAQVRRGFYLLYEVQKYMPIEVWRRADMARALQYKQQSLALAAELARPAG
jgi:fructosamine-3-kinase